ncbi:MAG: ASKHA domain-containing protein [Coriobacteriia bacterium]
MPRVTFIPEDISVEVREKENLLRAAIAAGINITASCGGDGTCGKCRVLVEEGAVHSEPSAKLPQELADSGYVLACRSQVLDDLVVRIPPEARPGGVPKKDQVVPAHVLASVEYDGFQARMVADPPVARLPARMKEPDISDSASDAARLLTTLRREHDIEDADVELAAIAKLPHVCRSADWDVCATVLRSPRGNRVLDVAPREGTPDGLAVAVDIGTTTVEAQLVDLANGQVLSQAAEYNAQSRLGDDVITRIIAARNQDGLDEMRSLVVGTVSGLVTDMLERVDASESDILSYIAAGNTVMTHLFLGVSPTNIRAKPYIPAASRFPWVAAKELGLPGSAATLLHCMPCPASYLGGDVIGGLVAAGIPWSDQVNLFVDIGTNGEIVLGNREWMVGCSCSAGPAFEGGGVQHGMRAAAGAIEQVRIDPETLEPTLLTIGCKKPLGICGSGLIDAASELFIAGALDRNGKFRRDLGSNRIREGLHGHEYVLVNADESATGHDIVLTEVDIENLIRAKAAVFAGIEVLTESVDIDISEIDHVFIAGAFGHYLDLDRVMVLGLMPELDPEKFTFVGNGSLIGARMAATCRGMIATSEHVAQSLTYLELSVNASFMESFVSAMFLPHTDQMRFPRTEGILASRGGES